ncbi:MAG: thiolase family protein [Saprospiraceae bacterium]|nr:MAG: acetyl-CoA acetyltransferase [Bacteroidetes bacterium OLB9]MCO6464790.1 thiolase family protein [Saprospiraceae bacterium]
MQKVYIVSASRTPIGSFGGVLSGISAPELGATAVKSAITKSGLTAADVEEIFFGQVVQANTGQAPARQVALGSGLNLSTPATTVNKVCASGMKAVMFGSMSIELGLNNVVVAGGMENMSQIPYYVAKGRYGYRYGHGQLVDGLVRDGLENVYDSQAMGCFADATAVKYEISREEQDRFAIQSYKRAAAAWEANKFKDEIAGVEIKDRKGNISVIDHDEEYKNVIFDKIPGLRPVFTKEGTVTAANASTINDGAAALILASEDMVKKHQLKPLARIVAYADGAHEPEWFTTAPSIAAEKALKRAGLSIGDIDFFEVNEAFAVVTLAFNKYFGVSEDKVNIYGGGVSLGHPLGCSGARIITTLTTVLAQNKGKYGLAALCNGGGGASAIIIENLV